MKPHGNDDSSSDDDDDDVNADTLIDIGLPFFKAFTGNFNTERMEVSLALMRNGAGSITF